MARVAETPAARAEDVPPTQERPARARPRRRWVWPAALAVLLAATVGVGMRITAAPDPVTRGDVQEAVKKGVDSAIEKQEQAPPDATQAYQTILPSLVLVQTQRDAGDGEAGGAGSGAAFVINDEGAVMTALHVVEGAQSITATFADGTESAARVVDADPANDIAVLQTEDLPEVVVPAVLGGGAQVGDEVFAVGHPLGLTRTLTAGVVSALDRSIRVEDGDSLDGLIQFDAAVNPGNSGGPLLNRSAQVIGVVTALANPSERPFFVGIAFAVPIATAGGAAGGPLQ